MRIKDINGNYIKEHAVNYNIYYKPVDVPIKGYSSLIVFSDSTENLIVQGGEKTIELSGTGYKWLNFLPQNHSWCMTAMYNAHGTLLEWYIDITKKNYFDVDKLPYFDDLFLDIVIYPNGEMILLDEDELLNALKSNEISKIDYDYAYKVYYDMLENSILSPQYFSNICKLLLSMYI